MLFKVAAVQIDTVYRKPDDNRKRAKRLIESALKSSPDIIIFPETWTTGYSEDVFHNVYDYAETEDGPTVTMIKELARENNVWIVAGSIIEKDNLGTYNTSFLIDRYGQIVGKYRKMHLYSEMDEDKGFKNGVDMPVFDTEFGKIALMTCYDIRFVEMSRTYALRGAEVIIVVSNWAHPKLNHWRTLLEARAIENQLYIVACNRVGKAVNSIYFGHSMIIDPWGEIIGEGSEEESILVGEIDTGRVREVRTKIPMYYDRQPHNYPYDIHNQTGNIRNESRKVGNVVLAQDIERMINNLKGTAGVIIKDVSTGDIVAFNEDIVFPAASIIKLPIIWELFKRIDSGEMSLDETVILDDSQKVGGFGVLKELHSGLNLTINDLAMLMIIMSDNTATNTLINRLGIENINNSIKSNGMKNTILQRRMMDYEVIKRGIDNFTSPADIMNILEKFLDSQDLSGDFRAMIIDILKRQQCNNKLPALLPEDIVFAHKTGDMPSIEHDVGILYTARGPVIVVVMTKNLDNNLDGVKLSNDIGKIVYDYYNSIK